MANLGSFGAAVREIEPGGERDTFEFCGETFTVHGDIPPMLMLQMGAALTGKIDEQEGLAAMWESLRICLTAPAPPATEDEPKPVPDSGPFDQFYKIAVDRSVELPDLVQVVMALFEAQNGRPTGRRSVSSDGPSTTSPSSSTSFSTRPDLAHLRPVAALIG